MKKINIKKKLVSFVDTLLESPRVDPKVYFNHFLLNDFLCVPECQDFVKKIERIECRGKIKQHRNGFVFDGSTGIVHMTDNDFCHIISYVVTDKAGKLQKEYIDIMADRKITGVDNYFNMNCGNKITLVREFSGENAEFVTVVNNQKPGRLDAKLYSLEGDFLGKFKGEFDGKFRYDFALNSKLITCAQPTKTLMTSDVVLDSQLENPINFAKEICQKSLQKFGQEYGCVEGK